MTASTAVLHPTAADAATGLHIVNFDNGPALRLDASASGSQAFEVDVDKRIVKGLIVPYGVPAFSNGKKWQFAKGSLKFADVKRVKLWVQHKPESAIGVATSLEETDEGMTGTFSIARGAEGDRVLALAEDGVLDGFSIGLGRGVKAQLKGDVHHVFEAPLMETSLTPAPSFDDARVHSVAASAAGEDGTTTTDVGVVIAKALLQGFSSLERPQDGREVVSATDGQFHVDEPSPYRFDGMPGEHSFSADLQASASGDSEAKQRLTEFMEQAFAVTTGNTGTLNPTQNRPDLYVPNLQFTRPLWDLVSTGSISDKTPFTVPKFSSASGLVGDHTEGVEPTPGAFAATNQTVSPAPVSGKIEINREVWDQGGSPQADAIIWNEMLNGWFEAIEAKIAARLATTGTAELNLASAEDDVLVDALTAYFAGLQFVRGGNRFTAFAADGNLFPKLVAAKDGNGRALLPVVGPQNAQGQTSGGFDRVNLGAQNIRAAWALGTGLDKKSYNFVPSSVWAWASAPKRFTFEYQVKSIDMAIWGYVGTAILRDSDVKPVDYTTADA